LRRTIAILAMIFFACISASDIPTSPVWLLQIGDRRRERGERPSATNTQTIQQNLSVFPRGALARETTTIGESRPVVTVTPVAAGRISRQRIGASSRGSLRSGVAVHRARPASFSRVVNDTPKEGIMTMRKGRSADDPRQGDFLGLLDSRLSLLPAPRLPDVGAPLTMDRRVRELLNVAIAESGMDRETIAAELSPLAGRRITKAQIDSWTGASRLNRFPSELLAPICAVLGNTILLEGVAQAVGCTITTGYNRQLARLGQLALFMAQAGAERDAIIADLPVRAARHG